MLISDNFEKYKLVKGLACCIILVKFMKAKKKNLFSKTAYLHVYSKRVLLDELETKY